MCEMGEDETVEHVILKCEKYGKDRIEMMRAILAERDIIRMKWWKKQARNGCC